jgi:hypothetical protein
MTKAMIFIGVALGAVLITGVILSLVAPKKISVRSRHFIRASKQQVFDQLRFMKNYPDWSPFLVQDPEQKFVISGTDGEIGATYSWEGVKEKSKGSQSVIAMDGNDGFKIQCQITEPFQAQPSFTYSLTEKNGGIEIIQDFESEMPVPANIFGLLLGLKNKIAATNHQGLNLLKQAAEKKSLAND